MIRIHLSKLLGEKRITQAELARRTRIRPSTINEIYWELIERINLEHIDLICKELDCDIQDFIEVLLITRINMKNEITVFWKRVLFYYRG